MLTVAALLNNPFVTLFAVIALGLCVGSFRLRRISLGSAGVLVTALPAGHLRSVLPRSLSPENSHAISVPSSVTVFGLVLFFYAVGLQAGPRFVTMFRGRVKAYVTIGLGSIGSAALTAVLLAHLLHLSPSITAGLFTGALTNTPALASGRDIAQRLNKTTAAEVSVGHGLAYPFSAIFVVVLVQLLPSLLRQPPSEAAGAAAQEARLLQPPLHRRQFRITNPNVTGRTVAAFHASGLSRATISRIEREGVVYAASPDMELALHDVVMAVGPEEEFEKLTAILGDPADDVSMYEEGGRIASETLVVSARHAVGRQLGDLLAGDFSDVIVTRVRRQGIELVPERSLVLEPADALRVVGHQEVVKRFAEYVGAEERRLSETSLLSFAAGICLGALLGMVPLRLCGGVHGNLDLGGGAFLVGLLLGHARRVGPFRVCVPQAAILFARELGLVVFLAGAGIEAGVRFAAVLHVAGLQTLFVGACVTIVASITDVMLAYFLFRWNALAVAGTLSGAMTNPPALNTATELAVSDAAPLAFSSLYPVAIIAKIVPVQCVFLAARMLQ